MTFDLGAALRKKEERESARLVDFDFRCRARATRLLAESLGLDPASVSGIVARFSEEAAIDHLAEWKHRPPEQITTDYHACLATARAQLVAERGDPTPHRLA